MPKNPLKFARRKSSANVLDEELSAEPAAPAVSSFRVLERPEKINLNGDYRGQADKLRQVQRPFNSPLVQLRGRSAEELSAGVNRGSGGTTNSGSSGYNESSSASARYSSTSTLPSSVDAEREPDEADLFPRKVKTTPMYQTHPDKADSPLPPPPSFSTRAARALSWGQKHNRNGSAATNSAPPIPPVPYVPERSPSPPHRERALTTSSYASTAVPSKPNLDLNLGSNDFGGDFSSMFDGSKNQSQSELLPPPPPPKFAYHRTESEPMFPPRTHSRQAFKPEELKNIRDTAGSPYSLDSQSSNEGLMSGASPMGSPRLPEDAPPVPTHASGITNLAPAFLGKSRTGYAPVGDRASPRLDMRMSHDSQGGYSGNGYDDQADSYSSSEDEAVHTKGVDLHDSQDEGLFSRSSRSATVTRKTIPGAAIASPATRVPLGMPSQATAGASRSGAMSPDSSEGGGSLWDSSNTTPRAAKAIMSGRDNSQTRFDSSPVGPPSRALRPQHMRTESGTPKKMTKEQFERLQRGDPSSGDQSDNDDTSADEYDAEDDADRAKRVAKQRQKQEANMAVYRQQMKKVTGGGPSDLPNAARPSMDRAAASAPGLLHFGGIGGQPPADAVRGRQTEDEDEDVPLGILAAHGFPNPSRPPTRQGGDDGGHQRRMSSATSVVGGGAGQGALPPFARRLPQDPYFGSSIVNQAHRESMGMSSAASVYGGAPPMQPQQQQMGHPGGLVGIIAGEERAKAARRGSPNPATGTFPGPGANTNGGGMTNTMGMGRSMTMSNMPSPQTYMPSGMGPNGMMSPMPGMPTMPGMPQMPMMPTGGDPQQEQMKQFMQMQMQFMQNMMAMQQQSIGQTPPPMPQQPQDYLSVPMGGNRQSMMSQQGQGAPSIRTQAPSMSGRAMTMTHPPTRWDLGPGAQRPNSHMPNTYAPSGMNMNGGGPGPGYSPSIAPSERSNIGMPTRYRPVTSGNDGMGRSQTMGSGITLNAFHNQQQAPSLPSQPPPQQRQSSTIRMLDKPKGAPRMLAKPSQPDEDEDEGWAEMKKKREKKKFGFGKKNKAESPTAELYQTSSRIALGTSF